MIVELVSVEQIRQTLNWVILLTLTLVGLWVKSQIDLVRERRRTTKTEKRVDDIESTLPTKERLADLERDSLLNQVTRDCLDRTQILINAQLEKDRLHEEDRARWLVERDRLVDQKNSLDTLVHALQDKLVEVTLGVLSDKQDDTPPVQVEGEIDVNLTPPQDVPPETESF